MSITDVEVRVGVTKNIGNYESVRLDYSARAALGQGVDPLSTMDSMRENLEEKVKVDVNEVEKSLRSRG